MWNIETFFASKGMFTNIVGVLPVAGSVCFHMSFPETLCSRMALSVLNSIRWNIFAKRGTMIQNSNGVKFLFLLGCPNFFPQLILIYM